MQEAVEIDPALKKTLLHASNSTPTSPTPDTGGTPVCSHPRQPNARCNGHHRLGPAEGGFWEYGISMPLCAGRARPAGVAETVRRETSTRPAQHGASSRVEEKAASSRRTQKQSALRVARPLRLTRMACGGQARATRRRGGCCPARRAAPSCPRDLRGLEQCRERYPPSRCPARQRLPRSFYRIKSLALPHG